jgi:hypothetical protein
MPFQVQISLMICSPTGAFAHPIRRSNDEAISQHVHGLDGQYSDCNLSHRYTDGHGQRDSDWGNKQTRSSDWPLGGLVVSTLKYTAYWPSRADALSSI